MAVEETVDLEKLSLDELLVKRRALKRKLSARDTLQPVRIAVLGGSTTNEVVDLLELWLLHHGVQPAFYQSEYGRYYVEAVHDSSALAAFAPDITYLHTSVNDIQSFPPMEATDADLDQYLQNELRRFEDIWNSLEQVLGCVVIQNNFELPQHAILGNLDGIVNGGRTRFVAELNRLFASAASKRPRLLLQDVASLSARIGLNHWFAPERWFSYKLWTTVEASNAIARSLSAIVRALYGKTRKVLVLDLDNTLWGGVIGDDGVDKIQIGRETPLAEAYTAFQEYCLSLRNRGVLLAVCSKNDDAIARSGFEHPDSVLKLEHISSFQANWSPKHENLEAIARELSLGVDSFVFVDDNPAERAIVQAQLPAVAVPDVGSDVAAYPFILEAGRFFEQTSFSREDLERASLYQENVQRAEHQSKFASYGEYLDSLEMTAEIERFKPVYIERIAQLTNKTNQFNLTTRRYTLAEMEALMHDPGAIGLYGKLSDRFGDNGLISIVLGRRHAQSLTIDLWLMSCRVLKRDMEAAMLDALATHAAAVGITSLRGQYIPTRKNGMVASHYIDLGFTEVSRDPAGPVIYTLDLAAYTPRNTHISIAT